MSRNKAKPRSHKENEKINMKIKMPKSTTIEAYICSNTRHTSLDSHNHTASLLELPQHLGQQLLGQLLQLVGLLLLALVLTLLALVPRRLARIATVLGRMVGRHDSLATSQVHIDTTRIFFSGILQTQLTTHLLDTRLDFLNVIGRVISLADDARSRYDVSRSYSRIIDDAPRRSLCVTYTCK